jgi:glycosyltransferase involved in cell wall biosynthesis
LKILIVSFTFPPELGGVAEVARTQVNGFARRGHEVSVATTFDARRTADHAPPGVKIDQFRVNGSFEAGRGYHGELAAYQEFIAHHSADLILFHCWQNWTVDVALPALPRNAARKILLSHGVDAQLWKRHRRFPWGLGQWLRTFPYALRLPGRMKAFDRLVFLSARCDAGRFFDGWLAKRVCPEKISVIPNGVHLGELRSPHGDFRQSQGIDSQYLALHVASYDDRKNQLATLQDFMALNRNDVTLVFIGGEFNEYQARAAAKHDQLKRRFSRARVRFLQKIPKPMIYAAYQTADLFLLGAKYETQPLAILDAMAAGVPFISTNAGCVGEFPGGLVRGTGRATTQAIAQLLDDGELRRRLGADGRAACAEKYDWERVLDAYENLFQQLH